MPFNFIFLIFIVSAFVFLLFQCYQFVENYDYIQKFNDRHEKYEFTSSPNFNFVDKTFYDPNDTETVLENKWFCKSKANTWYGISPLNGMVLKNKSYARWSSELECTNFIFSKFFLNYNNPCSDPSATTYCNIFKELK